METVMDAKKKTIKEASKETIIKKFIKLDKTLRNS